MNFIELNNYFILCYYIIQKYKNHKQLNIKGKKTKDKKRAKHSRMKHGKDQLRQRKKNQINSDKHPKPSQILKTHNP